MKQFLVICLTEQWVQVPAGPLYAWGRKTYLSSFFVRTLTAEGLSDPQTSCISPISIRSWQRWDLL